MRRSSRVEKGSTYVLAVVFIIVFFASIFCGFFFYFGRICCLLFELCYKTLRGRLCLFQGDPTMTYV